MISYKEFFSEILLGPNISDKLIDCEVLWNEFSEFNLPSEPGRIDKIKFSKTQLKFPKSASLTEDNKKALALHSFANHELLAIEMMAGAILYFPHNTEEDIKFKKGMVSALRDEQKHFKLYVNRLNELGYSFGDFPVNDFFWRQMEKLKSPSEFICLMSLTLEAANLDFANYYSNLFKELGDEKTAQILDIVLKDEISHVAFGTFWMNKWRQNKKLWDYYLECLPWPMTPIRSKGIQYSSSLHFKAMSDQEFVDQLDHFDDPFKVTRRRSNVAD